MVLTTDKAAVKWAISTLESNGYSTTTHRQIVQTAYSVIHKIVTSDENFYLKQTPASTTFSLEPAITRLLENKFQAPVPVVIAVHEERHCFLMKEAGLSLRAYLKTNFQPNLIFEAIKQFTRMQRTVENHLEDFVALGVSDWRKTLPALYDKLLDDVAVLEGEGFRTEEIQHLISLKPQLAEELQLLVQYAVPQTIVQSDFHTNNILIHPETKKMVFNDLGKLVITHPFFSLHGFLKQAITHHGIKEGDKINNQMQEACLESWPEFEAMTVFTLTKKLWPLYSALIFYRFMNSLDKDVFKALNAHRPYRLAGFLREYIA